ncbi:MAG: hypothetical protein MRY63_07105 [Neomegalonema sp.]|nr:hypothetical protein [Neomegalonema sp.]
MRSDFPDSDGKYPDGGADIIYAGSGNDIVHSHTGKEFVSLGDGNDTLHTGGGHEFYANAGDGVDTAYFDEINISLVEYYDERMTVAESDGDLVQKKRPQKALEIFKWADDSSNYQIIVKTTIDHSNGSNYSINGQNVDINERSYFVGFEKIIANEKIIFDASSLNDPEADGAIFVHGQ